MNRKTIVALLATAAVALGVAGCAPPHRDATVPASGNMWASCPPRDLSGRVKDGWLAPPVQWVCVTS